MISVLLPTRKRPHFLERMINSLMEMSDRRPEVVVYIDDDDNESEPKALELGLKVIRGPRITMSDYWNKCYEESTGDILMQAADDIVFKTKGWDKMVEDAFANCPDKIMLVHGDDLDPNFNPSFGSHPLVHRCWIETTGYFIPPYFSSDYSDWWIMEVAKFIERKKYLPFVTEHMHLRTGKAPMDSTYFERLQRHDKDRPGELYTEKFFDRLADAEKLQSVINQYAEVHV